MQVLARRFIAIIRIAAPCSPSSAATRNRWQQSVVSSFEATDRQLLRLEHGPLGAFSKPIAQPATRTPQLLPSPPIAAAPTLQAQQAAEACVNAARNGEHPQEPRPETALRQPRGPDMS